MVEREKEEKIRNGGRRKFKCAIISTTLIGSLLIFCCVSFISSE